MPCSQLWSSFAELCWLDTRNHVWWFSASTYDRVKFRPAPLVKKQTAFGCKWYPPLKNPKHKFQRKYRGVNGLSLLCGPYLIVSPSMAQQPLRQKAAACTWIGEHLEISSNERLVFIVRPWRKTVGQVVYPSAGVSSDKNTPCHVTSIVHMFTKL